MTSTEKNKSMTNNDNVQFRCRTAVMLIWQSHQWDDDFTSCLRASVDPPSSHVWIVVSTFSTCAVGKVLYLVQEFFLLHPSGRRICISQPTDLDIITSEREITLAEQLALLAICCTSARLMAVCGPEIQSIPVHSPGSKLVYPSIRWCVFQRIKMSFLRVLMTLAALLARFVPLVCCLVSGWGCQVSYFWYGKEISTILRMENNNNNQNII